MKVLDFERSPSWQANLRWLVILPAICLPLVASFYYFVWFPGTVFGKAIYGGIKVFQMAWPFIAIGWILKERFQQERRPQRHGQGLIAGALFGVSTLAVMFVLLKLTPVGEVIYSNGDRIVEKISQLGVKNHFLLFALMISFFHAALEEFFWRYFAFGQLRRLVSVMPAAVISSLGFAAHHMVVLSQYVPLAWAVLLGLGVAFGGAVWCFIYQRYHSLVGVWISHMIIDLGIMWVGWELLSRP